MRGTRRTVLRWIVLIVFGLLLIPSFGCVGMTAQLMYIVYGQEEIPAQCDKLEGKRVAVVCISDSSPYGPDKATEMMARYLAKDLRNHVDEIEMVHPGEVNDWIDNNNWDQIDFRKIGRGVDADVVLAIQVSEFGLHEGPTLYRGHANVKVTLIDMRKDGEVVFQEYMPDFEYPRESPLPAFNTTERRFQRTFVTALSRQVAHMFYAYPMTDDLASDTKTLSR